MTHCSLKARDMLYKTRSLRLVTRDVAGIGCHVHYSIDGGKSFKDITDEVYSKENLQECKGEHTPVPYFMQEGAVLGSDTGNIITCKDVSLGDWRKLCRVAGHITTITAKDRSPSSVTH